MSQGSGFRILAICSGNVCRSPFAELLLKRRLVSRDDITVASAGTVARPGQHMTAEMMRVAARFGIETAASNAHVAHRLHEVALERADLALALTREHRAAAVHLVPSAVKRVFTLKEFARLVGSPEMGRSTASTAADLVTKASERRGLDTRSAPTLDDIPDPIGLSQAVYDRVGAEIAEAIDVIASALTTTYPRQVDAAEDYPSSGGPRLSFSFRRL